MDRNVSTNTSLKITSNLSTSVSKMYKSVYRYIELIYIRHITKYLMLLLSPFTVFKVRHWVLSIICLFGIISSRNKIYRYINNRIDNYMYMVLGKSVSTPAI